MKNRGPSPFPLPKGRGVDSSRGCYSPTMGGSSLASPRGGWRGLFFTNIGDFRELSFIPIDILGKFKKNVECRV